MNILIGRRYSLYCQFLEPFCQFLKRQASICISQWGNNIKTPDYYGCPTRICVRAILFPLYINDRPTVIEKSQITTFADDRGLLKSGKKGEHLIQPMLKDYETGSLVTNYLSMSKNVKLFHLALKFHKSLIFWRNL